VVNDGTAVTALSVASGILGHLLDVAPRLEGMG
jgi:hypothetical protein